MTKISRNDPCPCGSGKKYKKCCIDKIIPLATTRQEEHGEQPRSPNDFFELAKKHFQENSYESIEQMNDQLGKMSAKFNSAAVDDFLGLSPEQMRKVLYSPFSPDNEIFTMKIDSESELGDIPLLNQAWYFLEKIKEAGELKATQKGNLPKVLVLDVFEKFFSNDRYAYKPNKEDDLPEITRLKHLLMLSGVIKKRLNKFSLTKKGEDILLKKKRLELYELIFINLSNEFNWGFLDRYPELALIQHSVAFNFLLLKKKCTDWTLDKDLGEIFLKAFPALLREIPASNYSTPEEIVINCFCLRFLQRYCLPLGIVKHKEEKIKTGRFFNYLDYHTPTSFFLQNFKFHIDG